MPPRVDARPFVRSGVRSVPLDKVCLPSWQQGGGRTAFGAALAATDDPRFAKEVADATVAAVKELRRRRADRALRARAYASRRAAERRASLRAHRAATADLRARRARRDVVRAASAAASELPARSTPRPRSRAPRAPRRRTQTPRARARAPGSEDPSGSPSAERLVRLDEALEDGDLELARAIARTMQDGDPPSAPSGRCIVCGLRLWPGALPKHLSVVHGVDRSTQRAA
jgi:hypothetical protein